MNTTLLPMVTNVDSIDHISNLCDQFLQGNNTANSELYIFAEINNNTSSGKGYNRNMTQFCLDYSAVNTRLQSSNEIPNIPKIKTFYMEEYDNHKTSSTTSFYGEYDPQIGIRIALVLGSFLLSVILYTLYKTKCRRDRWTHDDKQFIDRYSKILAQKWSGKTPNARPGMEKTKQSIDETAKWICSQPLQEVSLLNKWAIQDTMYNICLESIKASARPVTEIHKTSPGTNNIPRQQVLNVVNEKDGSSGDVTPNSVSPGLCSKTDPQDTFIPNGFSTPISHHEEHQGNTDNIMKGINKYKTGNKTMNTDKNGQENIALLFNEKNVVSQRKAHSQDITAQKLDQTFNTKSSKKAQNTPEEETRSKNGNKSKDSDSDGEGNETMFSPSTQETSLDILSPNQDEPLPEPENIPLVPKSLKINVIDSKFFSGASAKLKPPDFKTIKMIEESAVEESLVDQK